MTGPLKKAQSKTPKRRRSLALARTAAGEAKAGGGSRLAMVSFA